MSRFFIVAAKRTPQGCFLGKLSRYSAVDLAVAAGENALSGIDPAVIDLAIVGNILSAGQGMNIARQISVKLGVPVERTAFTVNMMCASGLWSVVLAAQAIKTGEASVVLCGGTESMSNAPYLLERARQGYKLGDGAVVDSILRDGLVDSFDHQHMGMTAERLANEYDISRSEQDTFAEASQRRYAEAASAGHFDAEMITMDELDRDEHPRPETTLEHLATLKPVFDKNGSVTAGNASGINDGAAILVVCNEEALSEHNWVPLAEVGAWASVGCDPQYMGLGPVYATRKLCEQNGYEVDQFDTIEINEAFAVQTLACIKELNLDREKVNQEGGAIALGHPVGASGARLATHLAHRIHTGNTAKGLATLCVGGGMGVAVTLQSVS
jgi:acetyl-CoA C-acetyltransferase